MSLSGRVTPPLRALLLSIICHLLLCLPNAPFLAPKSPPLSSTLGFSHSPLSLQLSLSMSIVFFAHSHSTPRCFFIALPLSPSPSPSSPLLPPHHFLFLLLPVTLRVPACTPQLHQAGTPHSAELMVPLSVCIIQSSLSPPPPLSPSLSLSHTHTHTGHLSMQWHQHYWTIQLHI